MAGAKPPNILVLSAGPGESGDACFQRMKTDILLILGQDRYTVYPLTRTDVLKQPWQENCLLLVVPPHISLSSETRQSVLSYITRRACGGKCLSFNHQLMPSATEASSVYTDDGVIEVVPCNTSSERFHTISIDRSDGEESLNVPGLTISGTNGAPAINGSGHNSLSKESDEVIVTDIATAFVGDVNRPCIQQLTWSQDNEGGQLIYSSVHLFNPLSYTSGLPGVIKIKETGQERQDFLKTAVFNCLGLKVGTEAKRVGEELSHLYLITKNGEVRRSVLSRLMSHKAEKEKEGDGWFMINGTESSCLFVTDDYSIGTPVDPLPPTNEKQVTVLLSPSKQQVESLEFDSSLYFKSLKTDCMGQSLLLGPVMTSSQTLFTGNSPLTKLLTNELGVVCSPGQQTRGKGRGGNVWLSPKGCMMFSVPLHFPIDSRLGRTASIVQHIATLSVVTAVRRQSGYEDVPIQVKWPNDIYYNGKVKLGGCLATAYTTENTTTIIIGLGVNVSNHYPTLSINDCISLYNTEAHKDLPLLRLESLLGLTLNNLEMYLSLYNQWGLTAIEGLYYQYWMHHNATVKLSGYPWVESAIITGINDYGYLRVKTRNNEYLSLGPDGNTFDIMKGLITMK